MSLKLSIGALGPTIAEQVAAQGFTTTMPAEFLERLEDAIHLLRIHDMLTYAESDRALKRLIKAMGASSPSPPSSSDCSKQPKGGA